MLIFSACSEGSQKVDEKQEASTILRVGYISQVGGTEDNPSLVGPEGWARNIGILDNELRKSDLRKLLIFPFPTVRI